MFQQKLGKHFLYSKDKIITEFDTYYHFLSTALLIKIVNLIPKIKVPIYQFGPTKVN